MKKIQTLFFSCIGLIMLLLCQSAYAGRAVDNVTLNGGGSVTVAAGDLINVGVTVTMGGRGNDNWRATRYDLSDGSGDCVDHSNYNSGQETETFQVTAPTLAGSYDITVTAYQNDNCNGGSDSESLVNSITVIDGGGGDAECSDYIGSATINEAAQAKGGDPSFVEIKMFNILLLVASSWRLEVCDSGGCASASATSTLSNSSGLGSNSPWYVFEGGADFDDSKLDFQNGFSVALLDGSGDAIDVLSVNGFSVAQYDCSSFDYDTDYTGTNNGTKFVYRAPDGVGDWDKQQGNNVTETPGGENGGGGNSTVHHYAITTSDTAVACESGVVTIEPHNESHIPVSNDGETISLSTIPANNGWVKITGNGALSGNQYTFSGGESQVIFGLMNTVAETSFPETLNINVTDGTLSDLNGDAFEDEPLTFTEVGLRFYDDNDSNGDADGVGNDLPNQTAGVLYQQGLLKVIKVDDATGQCVGALQSSASLPVSMAYECNNPSSCIRDKDLTLAGTAVEENDNAAVSDYETVNLSFDVDSEAPFSIEYFDAGQITLHALMTIPANGDDPEVVGLTGESNPFIVKPADLVITDIPDNPATQSSGLGFKAANEPFTVEVTARNDDGGTTPNYGKELVPENVTLQLESIIFPVGGSLGTLFDGTFALTSTDGVFESSTVRWDEVGTFRASARVASGNYLSFAGDVVGTTSGDIGRFYPDHFILTDDDVTNACESGGFSYMGQPDIGVIYTVSAEKLGGGTVSNYDNDSLLYPVATLEGVAENLDSGVDLSSRLTLANPTWTAGEAVLSDTSAMFDRVALYETELSSLVLGLQLVGELDSRNFDSLDMNAATAGSCLPSGCDARELSGDLRLRYGRLATKDAHGPESTPLPVVFQAEYWNGSAFVINRNDDCTAIPRSLIDFDGTTILAAANLTVPVGGSNTTGTFSELDLLSVTLNSGDAGLVFTAPGVGTLASPNTGSFPVDVDLTGFPWLQIDWDKNGSDDGDVPSAIVNFGSYRGHDRVIYWQERLAD